MTQTPPVVLKARYGNELPRDAAQKCAGERRSFLQGNGGGDVLRATSPAVTPPAMPPYTRALSKQAS